MKFQWSILAGFLFISAATQAATVNVSSSANVAALRIGDTFTVDVQGAGFEADIVGGAFALAFDTTVLHLDSWATDTSVWALGGGSSAVTGDYYFNAFSPSSNYPKGEMNIGDLKFSVVGLGSTTIVLADPILNWATTGGQAYPNQNQIQYGSLTVSAVPAPASYWMFGTGLMVLGWMRRGRFPKQKCTDTQQG
jgi:hypothetical protein